MSKCQKLVCNLHNEKYYVLNIKILTQALNHGLVSQKVHGVTEFNEEE